VCNERSGCLNGSDERRFGLRLRRFVGWLGGLRLRRWTRGALATATPAPAATATAAFAKLVRTVARCDGCVRPFGARIGRSLDHRARLLRLARRALCAGLAFAWLTRLARLAVAATVPTHTVAARFAHRVVPVSLVGLAIAPYFPRLPLAPRFTVLAILATRRSLRFDRALPLAASVVAGTCVLALTVGAPLVAALTFAPSFGPPPVPRRVATARRA